jgi:hypothetical protein
VVQSEGPEFKPQYLKKKKSPQLLSCYTVHHRQEGKSSLKCSDFT